MNGLDVNVVPTFFLLFSFTFLKIFTIVLKNIGKSVFVAVQDSCTYAGTKLCLNDHYLCETFCLGWTIHYCNTTSMWGLISLLVLIEHLPQLAWLPTHGTPMIDVRPEMPLSVGKKTPENRKRNFCHQRPFLSPK